MNDFSNPMRFVVTVDAFSHDAAEVLAGVRAAFDRGVTETFEQGGSVLFETDGATDYQVEFLDFGEEYWNESYEH